jgi:hypothetical protein
MRRHGTLACVLALTVACGGSGVQGRYLPQGDTFFQSMTFRPDGKVEIMFINSHNVGAYAVDGDNVTITSPNGEQARLTIDANGCLTSQVLGTYCKDGARANTASAGNGSSQVALSQVYEAQASEGRIALEFGAAKKVRLTMTPSGGSGIPDRVSFDVAYEVSGNEISIALPGNEPLTLTRTGDGLMGTMNGETVRFTRR